MKKSLITGLFALFTLYAWAQDPQFTQFNTTPTHINPAYTGMTNFARAFLHSRAQWVKIPHENRRVGRFDTHYFSFDHYNVYSHTGLGGYVVKETAGHIGLETLNLAFSFSREQKLADNLRIVGALQVDYWQRSLNPDNLRFADQYSIDQGYLGLPSIENLQNMPMASNLWNMSTGFLLSHTHFWGGFSVHHLLQGKYLSLAGVEDDNTLMQQKYSIELGIAPPNQQYRLHTLYRKQGNSEQIDIGVNYNLDGRKKSRNIKDKEAYHGLIMGLYYRGLRNREAIAPLIRYQSPSAKGGTSFTFAYSYDFTISKLGNTGGSHELTLSIILGVDDKKREQNLKKIYKCDWDKARQIMEDYGWTPNKWGGMRNSGRKAFPIMRTY